MASSNIKTKKYADGLAFLKNGHEIAFYSSITNDIRYNTQALTIVYPGFYGLSEWTIPFDDNLEIISMVKSIYRKDV